MCEFTIHPMVYHTIMMNFIEIVLCRFESYFSRKAAFRWFVTITVGLMFRSDKLGHTSVIRDLALSPGSYDSMLHFFRASSWSLEDIRRRWFSAAMDYVTRPLVIHSNRGVQYTCGDYEEATGGMERSYSAKACPWDNACIESFQLCIKVPPAFL